MKAPVETPGPLSFGRIILTAPRQKETAVADATAEIADLFESLSRSGR